MTPKKLLEIRQSEIRQRLAQLAETDATPETETEIAGLSKEYQAAEVRMQAMIIADDKPEPVAVETRENGDPADREYRNMVDRSNLGTLLQNIMENRNHDGALAELQKHHGLAGNQIPLALLTDREVRAATPIPGEIQQTQRMIVPPVYATGDAAFLMIPQITVPAGDAVFPIMSNRASVGGPHLNNTDVAETDGTWTADVLQPGRIQASYKWLRTSASRFPGMEEALREALNMGITEKLDAQMLAQILTDVARTDATGLNTFATYRTELVYDRLDGRYSTSESDVRLLVGSETLAHMASAYRGNSADDSAADSLRRISSGVRISAHIAAVNADKQDVIVRRGMRDDAVIALWDGPVAIFDEYTGSGAGEIELTVVHQCAWKVTRAAGFARMEVQHA